MKAIRGAIAVVNNSPEAVEAASVKLIRQICQANNLTEQDITMLIFSATDDLSVAYPAQFVRKAGFGQLPMLCLQEMKVEGSLEGCLRVLALVNKDLPICTHVYLGEARKLRPDWAGESNGI